MSDSRPQTEVTFRPLTDGLGFHPFSDGLPYAPLGKKVSPKPDATARARVALGAAKAAGVAHAGSGVGATAAGVAQPVLPQRPNLRVKVPVAQTMVTTAKTVPTTVVSAALLPAVAQNVGALYLLKRLTAYFLDTFLNFSVCVATLGTLFLKENVSTDLFNNSSVVLLAVLFLGVFNWTLITAQELAFGTSAGKRLMGLVLRGSTSAVFLRAVLFIPSLGLCGLGILWSAVDPKSRCWHDRLTGLQPLEIARL